MSIFGKRAGLAGHNFGALEAARGFAGLSTETIAAALTEHLSDGQLSALGHQLAGTGPDALAEAEARGFRRGSQRAAELLIDAEFDTNVASEMLANVELDGLSVESLKKLGAHQPDAGAAELLAVLRADKTPPLGAWGGDDRPQADDRLWARAQARAEKQLGLGTKADELPARPELDGPSAESLKKLDAERSDASSAAMRAVLRANHRPRLDTSGAGAGEASAGWKRAIAKVNKERGDITGVSQAQLP